MRQMYRKEWRQGYSTETKTQAAQQQRNSIWQNQAHWAQGGLVCELARTPSQER